jgi:hypothetical protein
VRASTGDHARDGSRAERRISHDGHDQGSSRYASSVPERERTERQIGAHDQVGAGRRIGARSFGSGRWFWPLMRKGRLAIPPAAVSAPVLAGEGDGQDVKAGDTVEVPQIGCSDAPSGSYGGRSDDPVVCP